MPSKPEGNGTSPPPSLSSIGSNFTPTAARLNVRRLCRRPEKKLPIACHKQDRSGKICIPAGNDRTLRRQVVKSTSDGRKCRLVAVGRAALITPPESPGEQRRKFDFNWRSSEEDWTEGSPAGVALGGFFSSSIATRVNLALRPARTQLDPKAVDRVAQMAAAHLTGDCRRVQLCCAGLYERNAVGLWQNLEIRCVCGPTPWRQTFRAAKTLLSAQLGRSDRQTAMDWRQKLTTILPSPQQLFFGSPIDLATFCDRITTVADRIQSAISSLPSVSSGMSTVSFTCWREFLLAMGKFVGDAEKKQSRLLQVTVDSSLSESQQIAAESLRVAFSRLLDSLRENGGETFLRGYQYGLEGQMMEILEGKMIGSISKSFESISLADAFDHVVVSLNEAEKFREETSGMLSRSGEKKFSQLNKIAIECGRRAFQLRRQLTVVDSNLCRWNFSPIVDRAVAQLHSLTQRTVDAAKTQNREINDRVIGIYVGTIKRIFVNPTAVEDFIRQLTTLDEVATVELPQLEELCRQAAPRWRLLLSTPTVLSLSDLLGFHLIFRIPQRLHKGLEEMRIRLERHRNAIEADVFRRQQLLCDRLNNFEELLTTIRLKTATSEHNANATLLKSKEAEMADVWELATELSRHERILEMGPSGSLSRTESLRTLFSQLLLLWSVVDDLEVKQHVWLKGAVRDLVFDEVELTLSRWEADVTRLSEMFAASPAQMGVVGWLQSRLAILAGFKPLLAHVCQPGMKDRHWEAISEMLGSDQQLDNSSTILDLIGRGITKHVEKVEDLGASAAKEFILEKSLLRMKQFWSDTQLDLVEYRDSGVFVALSFEEIQLALETQLAKTQTLTTSPFVGTLLPAVREWLERLRIFARLLDLWQKCQSAWLYLEPIFSSEDIAYQIPDESLKYARVDEIWRRINAQSLTDPRVSAIAELSGVLDDLQVSVKVFEEIQAGFNRYLEKKRLYFPRFFFLSNDELLEILAETRDPERVQPHLPKCFEGIRQLRFNEKRHILGMISAGGEFVPFERPLIPALAKGQVEKWLLEVEDMMVMTIRSSIQRAYKALRSTGNRLDWIFQWPSQVVQCATRLLWTEGVEENLNKPGKLQMFERQLTKELDELISLVAEDLSPLQRTVVESLIRLDVSGLDVVRQLLDAGVTSLDDFLWSSQLRYYWVGEEVVVDMMDCRLNYGYEYLGDSQRLVTTPLTTLCHRTLMTAIKFRLGGAPEGPAATGKTEAVKELAKAVGRQCVVFNCSDELDASAMGKFFKGVATSGCWSCFDEINRVAPAVLSVVANQLLSIQQALSTGRQLVLFDDAELALNPGCAVFFTMNPTYGGRSTLPDNLQALFRPVQMILPDSERIAQVLLYSCGFHNATELAVKLAAFHQQANQLLSVRRHYDFGLRAIRTVLNSCAALKRRCREANEEAIVARAVDDANRSKLIPQLFPTAPLADLMAEKDEVVAAAEDFLRRHNFFSSPQVLDKISQLYQLTRLRHGIVVVGEPRVGKSTMIRALSEATTDLKALQRRADNVRLEYVYPMALTAAQLFGQFDPVSHDWLDGIVGQIFRLALQTSPDLSEIWLVFDGPVEPSWVESLNSVLDDNRKLCLPSGEIIPMSSRLRLVFEVENLSGASPATISRCGVVQVDRNLFPIEQNFFIAAVKRVVSPSLSAQFYVVAAQILFDAVEWANLNSPQTASLHLNNIISLLATFVSDWSVPEFLHRFHLAFATFWGVAALLEEAEKHRWEEDFLALQSLPVLLGDEWELGRLDFLHSGVVDVRSDDESVAPSILLRPFRELFSVEDQLSHLLQVHFGFCHTSASLLLSYFLHQHVTAMRPLVLCGPSGCGKSLAVRNFLLTLDANRYAAHHIILTSDTTASQLHQMIVSRLERRSKGLYGPPEGLIGVIFIDNFDSTSHERGQSSPAAELLRQVLERNFLFDKKGARQIFLQDVTFILAGRSCESVSPRLLSRSFVLRLGSPSEADWLQMLRAILSPTCLSATQTESFARATFSLHLTVSQLFPSGTLPTRLGWDGRHQLRLAAAFAHDLTAATLDVAVDLWVSQVWRIYSDGLPDQTCREMLELAVVECLQRHNLDSNPSVARWRNHFSLTSEDHVELIQLSEAKSKIESRLIAPENESVPATRPFVLSDYATEHLLRLMKTLQTANGHVVNIGPGGQGRRSVTLLAGRLLGFVTFCSDSQMVTSRSEWSDRLKKMIRLAGSGSTDVLLVIRESHVTLDWQLEELSVLLNDSYLPDLFTLEEKSEIVEKSILDKGVRASQQEATPSDRQFWELFAANIRRRLHLVFCVSDTTRLSRFPVIWRCCCANWFDEWPDEAYESVGRRLLKSFDLLGPKDVDVLIDLCRSFHSSAVEESAEECRESGQKVSVTPAMSLEFLRLFQHLARRQHTKLTSLCERYKAGVERLDLARAEITLMQQQLKRLKPELEATSAETARLMVQIEVETVEVESAREVVASDEDSANRAAAGAQLLKDDCEADLAAAIPALETAVAALNTLKGSDITMLKTLKSPPLGIKLVMEAVCILLGERPARVRDAGGLGRHHMDFWPISQKLLGEMKFLDRLRSFDKDAVSAEAMAQIRSGRFLGSAEFEPERIRLVSGAAEGICLWVRAVEVYDRVLKIVRPKKQKLRDAEAQMTALMAGLGQKRRELSEVSERLQSLNDEFGAVRQRKKELEEEIDGCEEKLLRAENLINGLGGEESRWQRTSDDLAQLCRNFLGDVILATSVIAHLAPHRPDTRQKCVAKWTSQLRRCGFVVSDDFSLSRVLSDPVESRQWHLAGLPEDRLSLENAQICQSCLKRPLIVDPQGEARKWLRGLYGDRLVVVKVGDASMSRQLEDAVSLGLPLLLENVNDDVDSQLDPLLNDEAYRETNSWKIRLGGVVIDFNPEFRLFLLTRRSDTSWSADVSDRLTVVNFLVSHKGVEDALLSVLVAQEAPELQRRKLELLQLSADNERQLKGLEDRILEVLSTTKGNILDDQTAVEMLGSAKELSDAVIEEQRLTLKTEAEIDRMREEYRPVAHNGRVLFVCLLELRRLDPVYQFSQLWFTSLFSRFQSITETREATVGCSFVSRISDVNSAVRQRLYRHVSRCLTRPHQLLFAFLMAVALLKDRISAAFDDRLYRLFAMGQQNFSATTRPNRWQRSFGSDVSLKLREKLKEVSRNPDDLLNRIVNDDFDDEESSLHLTSLERLFLVKTADPNRLCVAVERFVSSQLHQSFLDPSQFSLAESFGESTNRTPIVVVLRPGFSPIDHISQLAEDLRLPPDKVLSVSLGRGQGEIAATIMRSAGQRGGWAILQNCHLLPKWMSTLEQIWEELESSEQLHVDFRLWLTTSPTPNFPASILQNGLKLSAESCQTAAPPVCSRNDDETGRLGVSLGSSLQRLHNALLERKEFGPFGWNGNPTFSDSDLAVAKAHLKEWIGRPQQFPLESLAYITARLDYGGKVVDEWDIRLLTALTTDLYCRQDQLADRPKGPEAVGLHPNLESFRNFLKTSEFLSSLAMTVRQPTDRSDLTSLATDKSLSSRLNRLRTVLTPWLLRPIQLDSTRSYFAAASIRRETEGIWLEAEAIGTDLNRIQEFLEGKTAPTTSVHSALEQIAEGTTPSCWVWRGEGKSKISLDVWLESFVNRCERLSEWASEGRLDSYWLPNFIYPQTFLSAVLIEFAEKLAVQSTLVSYRTDVIDLPTELDGPESASVLIQGLQLQGAEFDPVRKCLAELTGRRLNFPLPYVRILPQLRGGDNSSDSGRVYDCPVFNRRGLSCVQTGVAAVFCLFLPCGNETVDHWTRRGVAAVYED